MLLLMDGIPSMPWISKTSWSPAILTVPDMLPPPDAVPVAPSQILSWGDDVNSPAD